MATDHVQLLDRPSRVDRSLGHVHPEGNPHVHLHPKNIGFLATELARRLVVIDPDNSELYRSQLSAFQEALEARNWRMDGTGGPGLEGMPIIAHHEAWAYLHQWTGIKQTAAIERLPGVPPTAGPLQDVLELARSMGARAILRAPHEPSEGMEWLSDKAGIPIVELPFTVGGLEDVDDLFDLFDVTLNRLEAVRDQY